MKDNMPTLNECFENNKELEDFGLKLILMHSAGYTMEDFETYIKEMMADEDVKEVIKAMTPALKLALRELKRNLK